MNRSLLIAASIAVVCAACSSSTDHSTTGSGGSTSTASSAKAASSTGSEATSSSSTTTGTGGSMGSGPGTGGGDGGLDCSDPTNPMFNSCVGTFLAGCWAPDMSGTCTDMNGTTTWSDGSKYVAEGAMAGLYAPGETTPCIALVLGTDSFTATKGTETLKYSADSATMMGTITCPNGTTFTATSAQVTEFNTCAGLNCP
jgi:hypothetical protein